MAEWVQASSLEQVGRWPKDHARSLLWFGAPGCAVCTALAPAVLALAGRHGLAALYVDLSVLPAAAGHSQVLTVPALSLWLDGCEVLREARFIPLAELEARWLRLLQLRG
ncbi:hypothetical protein [Crenobacter caeni]|uniref:Thioredoxin family protein n=1 Tax=Crenobacter caeni TaxID=2705474 RepID=A0A6B2KRR8_9NEIS|nr:hypothetical protein [Crenobacter caeni]NDV12824.1 hypothetical protein [Crenobacter caeni]